ncbi:MAG: CAP domain-containing protein [Candidatus Limnocylindrales bacterium]
MRNHFLPSRAVLGAMALSAFAIAASLTWSVPIVNAAGAANAEAAELVRLINGERAYLGEAPLRVDGFLAIKARDGAVACPNDTSLVMQGRAKDFAVYGFPANAHLLRLCPAYTSMDAMKSWGYTGARGEVAALNGGYGTTKVTYTYGCTPSVRTCPGSTTSTYYTTDRVMTDWISSSTHYAIIVGAYDRIGCGAWIGSNGAYYYDCMLSLGGPTVSKPKSTPKPPTGTKVPAATNRPAATPTPIPLPTPTLAPSVAVPTVPSPTAVVAGVEQTAPTPPAVLPGVTAQGASQSSLPPGNSAPLASEDLGVAAGALAAIASLLYALLALIRRRRQGSRPVV